MSKLNQAKRNAAARAVEYVTSGMLVGLGTGSTAAFAIKLISDRIRLEDLSIQGVPTSRATAQLAVEHGIPVLEDFSHVDLTIDGADEVDGAGRLIKGGGGALTREKIVAAASTREIIIVDETKCVQQLGRFPLPVEITPFGRHYAFKRLKDLGCEVSMRQRNGYPIQTDNGNLIVDCAFNKIVEPARLCDEINVIPGVVENGLFIGLTDLVFVGFKDGHTEAHHISIQKKTGTELLTAKASNPGREARD